MRFPLGRKIDLTYVSNRFAVTLCLISLAFFFSYGEITRIPVLLNLYLTFVKTIIIFITWAIGREIDPDEAGTANLSAVLMVIMLGLFPSSYPFLLASLFLLLGTRILLRANGVKIAWPEFVAVMLFVLVTSLVYRFFLLELLMAVVFYLDYRLTPKNKNSFVFAGIFVVLALFVFLLINFKYKLSITLFDFIIVSVVVEVFLALTYLRRNLTATIDYATKKMEKSRLFASRVWLLVCVFIAVIYLGRRGLVIDLAGVAVIIAFILNSVLIKYRKKFRSSKKTG